MEFPSHFSPSLKDLISKLLQKEPTDRISISDIKLHPWMLEERREVAHDRHDIQHRKINEQVFQRLITTKHINFHNFPLELIRDAVLKKREYSFVVSYHLLLDDYTKKKDKKRTSNPNPEGNLTFLGNYDLVKVEKIYIFSNSNF